MFGWPAQDMLGRHVFDFMDDEARTQAQEMMLRCEQGVREERVFRFRRRDGRNLNCRLTAAAVLDARGEFAGSIALLTDLTALHSAEQRTQTIRDELQCRLREKEARLDEVQDQLHVALSAAQVGLFIWDVQTNEVQFTSSYKEQLGYRDTELPERFDAWESRLHTDDRDRVLQTVDAYLRNPWRDYHLEFRLRHRLGHYLWILSRASVEYDGQGRVHRMIGCHVDITPLKAAEEQNRKLREELYQVSRLSTMGHLTSGLAHEVSQPLTSIAAYARACLNSVERGDLSELTSALEKIRLQAEHGGAVIRKLRATIVHQSPDFQVYRLNDLIQTSVNLLEYALRRAEIRLNLVLANDLPDVCVNRVQLEQVLLNFIQNAIEAMKETPARQRNLLIRTSSVDAQGDRLELMIRDAGCGIESSRLQRLFHPFQTTKPTGMGLGLNISRSIIEAHGGRIEVESEVGVGSTFRITLPSQKPTTG
jgi:PAS domain S-box-containing protein